MIAVRRRFALVALVLHALGCGPPEHSTGPELGPEEGFVVMEGDPDWHTDSVSWIDNGSAANRFEFIAVALHANPDGPSHFLYEAPFHQNGCSDFRCFPQAANELLVVPGLAIGDLDRSPVASTVAFSGRSQTDHDDWIHTFTPGGENRRWLTGVEPTFAPDGSAIYFVSDGRDELMGLRPASEQSWVQEDELSGIAHPRVSPDGRYLAYSGIDVSRQSRRIWVHDLTAAPERFDDPVSLPDVLPGNIPGDGTDDDYPAWSPGGRYLAYRGKLRENILKDAIFVTRPGDEPEQPYRIADVSPGTQMSHLRWHPNGTVMLLILDGDVYSLAVPARYQDPL